MPGLDRVYRLVQIAYIEAMTRVERPVVEAVFFVPRC